MGHQSRLRRACPFRPPRPAGRAQRSDPRRRVQVGDWRHVTGAQRSLEHGSELTGSDPTQISTEEQAAIVGAFNDPSSAQVSLLPDSGSMQLYRSWGRAAGASWP